jgi:uncharacterized protein YndB with AHSA1/START domain
MITQHKTIKIKKTINAPSPRVFKSFSSIKEKAIWSAPPGDAIVFKKQNFKVDGVELFKCGPIGKLEYVGKVNYIEIIKDQRIIYIETVMHRRNKLATAMVTIELHQENSKTQIEMTVQVVSYVGEDLIKGCKIGYKKSLTSLKKYLEKN